MTFFAWWQIIVYLLVIGITWYVTRAS